jgi:hypothetical protein
MICSLIRWSYARRERWGTRGDATVTLTHPEFLERFLLHVLPKGFTKIRHFGLFAAGNVNTKLVLARQRLAEAGVAAPTRPSTPSDFRQGLLALTGIDIRLCPRCGVGILVRPLDPDTAPSVSCQARAPPHEPSVLPIAS